MSEEDKPAEKKHKKRRRDEGKHKKHRHKKNGLRSKVDKHKRHKKKDVPESTKRSEKRKEKEKKKAERDPEDVPELTERDEKRYDRIMRKLAKRKRNKSKEGDEDAPSETLPKPVKKPIAIKIPSVSALPALSHEERTLSKEEEPQQTKWKGPKPSWATVIKPPSPPQKKLDPVKVLNAVLRSSTTRVPKETVSMLPPPKPPTFIPNTSTQMPPAQGFSSPQMPQVFHSFPMQLAPQMFSTPPMQLAPQMFSTPPMPQQMSQVPPFTPAAWYSDPPVYSQFPLPVPSFFPQVKQYGQVPPPPEISYYVPPSHHEKRPYFQSYSVQRAEEPFVIQHREMDAAIQPVPPAPKRDLMAMYGKVKQICQKLAFIPQK